MPVATPADALPAALARLSLARDRYQVARNRATEWPESWTKIAERDAWLLLRRAIWDALNCHPITDPDPETED